MTKIFRYLLIAIIPSLLFSSSGFSVSENPKNAEPVKSIKKSASSIALTPLIGGYLFAPSEALNAAPLYGLRLSYDYAGSSIVDSIGVEGTVNYFSTTTKSGAQKADGFLFRTDAIYSFTSKNKWVPFFALGVGGILINKNSTHDASPFLDYGLGIKYFLENYLALRMDVRQLLVYNNVTTKNNFEFSTGLTYFFGKERIKKASPAPPKTEPTKILKAVPDIVPPEGPTPVPPDAATQPNSEK